MIRVEFAAMDSEVCESMSRSEFHFLIDLTGTYIESAAEEAWEYGGVEYARCRAADEDISAFDSVIECALFVFRIDFGDEFLLYAVSLAIVKEDAFGVQDGHVFRFYAVFEEQTSDRSTGSASAIHDDFHIFDLFADDFESTEECCQSSDRSAVLVIVEDRDVHDLFQFVFDVIAFRGRDIFEVDAGEVLFEQFDCVDEFLRILGVQSDRDRIDLSESLVQCGFAFHDRHSSSCADIAHAEDTGAIRNDGYDIASPGQFQGQVFIVFDREARSGYTRGVYDREVVIAFDSSIQVGLDHLMFFSSECECFFFEFCSIHCFLLKKRLILYASATSNGAALYLIFDGRKISAIEDLIHFLLQQAADAFPFLAIQLCLFHIEEVVIQIEIMDQHLRVENIFLIYIDVHHVVLIAQLRCHVVLDGIDTVVDEDLLALHVTRKAAHAVVSDDDIRIEGLEEKIQRIQRRDLPAGRYIDVCTEGTDAILRMHFRIRMDSDMALVKMAHHILLLDFFLCDQHRDGCALRVIVL